MTDKQCEPESWNQLFKLCLSMFVRISSGAMCLFIEVSSHHRAVPKPDVSETNKASRNLRWSSFCPQRSEPGARQQAPVSCSRTAGAGQTPGLILVSRYLASRMTLQDNFKNESIVQIRYRPLPLLFNMNPPRKRCPATSSSSFISYSSES